MHITASRSFWLRGFALATVAAATALAAILLLTPRAQASVVDLSSLGAPSGVYGVLESPADPAGALSTAGIPTVTTGGACADPALTPDLVMPSGGLCWHGGPVIHSSQIFGLTWDAGSPRSYWAGTRGYLLQFLRDISDGSNTLSSPFAVATQYSDSAGPAANQSVYGGSCIDFGVPGGSDCTLGATSGTAAGNAYPASGCPLSGSATTCLNDAQLQNELAQQITTTGLNARLHSGTSPLLVVLLPSAVESCIDSSGELCQAGSGAPAHFCSYHSHLVVGGADYAYVVQPWLTSTACDEALLPTPPQVSTSVYMGTRLVSPLSAGLIASLTDPDLNGWYAQAGQEIYDNGGCAPQGYAKDSSAVGQSGQDPYAIQPEFSNAGAMTSDPDSPLCAQNVVLAPAFVTPSPVHSGDVVAFDGSITASSLIVPATGYAWDFGDGSPQAKGPSVTHSYTWGGTYAVKLTTTDRGRNVQSLTETIKVAGPPPPVSTGTTGSGGTPPPPPAPTTPALGAKFQLLPQSLRAVLKRGIGVTLSAREDADGVAYVSIPAAVARRAHLGKVHGVAFTLARGAVSGVSATSATMYLRLPHVARSRLHRLHHLKLTLRLVLLGRDGSREAVDLAGRY